MQETPHTAFPVPLLQPLGHLSGENRLVYGGNAKTPKRQNVETSKRIMTLMSALKPQISCPSGVLVIDKPLRMSSMDAVAHVRRKVGRGKSFKVGHAGTLDPLATGVLVIALGAATRSIDQLMATDKRYETTIDLSAFTSTDDAEGERIETAASQACDEAQIRSALGKFTGAIMQSPPAFSAVKIGGQRAYKLARKGRPVAPPPRQVIVHALHLVRFAWPLLELRIHCGKGFYVRSLARELGTSLGTGGHCVAIRRTAVGPFTIERARVLEDLPDLITQDDLMPTDQALGMANSLRLSCG